MRARLLPVGEPWPQQIIPNANHDIVVIAVPPGLGAKLVEACESEHRVWFGRHGWTIEHPLEERLSGADETGVGAAGGGKMVECGLIAWLRAACPRNPGNAVHGWWAAEHLGGDRWQLTREHTTGPQLGVETWHGDGRRTFAEAASA